MSSPRPEGVYLLYATLALTAGETAEADRFLSAIKDTTPLVAQLHSVALAQREIQTGAPGEATRRLEASLDGLLDDAKPLATYWVGLSKASQTDTDVRRAGVLQLLYLPALYGKKYPELAAAGIYRSMAVLDELGDTGGSIALRKELLSSYESTVHAAKVRAGS